MSVSGRASTPHPLPALPVLGWSAFGGGRAAPIPEVIEMPHARHTVTGRSAIALALRVLGVKPGDGVLVPTYHCPTMIAPIVRAGADPVFYPVTASGGPDLQWIERAHLGRVRALLCVHFFGLPQPMAAVRALCDAHGIGLIEDCAHALFGSTDGRPVGHWGDVAVASLWKFLPVPEGGLIASTTRSLADLEIGPRTWSDEIRALVRAVEFGARHGGFPGVNSVLRCVFDASNRLRSRSTVVASPPAPGRASDIVATALADPCLLPLRPAFAARWIAGRVHRSRVVELRRRNYADLSRRFARVRGARPLRADLPECAAPYVFPLLVDAPAASYLRVRDAGVPIYRWDEIWPGTPALEGDHGLRWATGVFQLGCHQDLSAADIEAMATSVRDVIEGA